MSASVFDVFEFCRRSEKQNGTFSAVDLPRLKAEAVYDAVVLDWSLQGGTNSYGHPELTMQVTGKVPLICQRCMKPFNFPVQSAQVLALAKSDAQADEIENLIDDKSVDVIVGDRSTKILELIEDEALLALPSSPRHETCPGQESQTRLEEVRKPSPFDVLKRLEQ